MGGSSKSSQSTTTNTDSLNRYLTVNRVFDNAGNVTFGAPAPAAATEARAAGNTDKLALAAVGVGVALLFLRR